MVLEEVIMECSGHIGGVSALGSSFLVLAYADDTFLLADSLPQLGLALNLLGATANSKRMTYDFIPYIGKFKPVDDPSVPDLKQCGNIVLHLAQTIPTNIKHLLFFNNWFTSLSILEHRASRDIWCCGTV
ncbi:unnamed protein product [Lepeophtheirus salmonis]|uniref:(salmon louse) hypothetical protein n=1 Tax=Lepeophtheirus salmonis TaxID=72036 RepID=A0A7R8H2V3_LEPSM|nr:unnamed protein product [Lepeophtheirus salmonis]CAF2821072.1 unnamed protein product [Lepeophtheirus salmonis]